MKKTVLLIALFLSSFTLSQDVILTFDCPEEVPSGSDGNWFSFHINILEPNIVTDMNFDIIINPNEYIDIDINSYIFNDPFFNELFLPPCIIIDEGINCPFDPIMGNFFILSPGTYTVSYSFSATDDNSEVIFSFEEAYFSDINNNILEIDYSDLCTIQIVSEGNEEIIVDYQLDWNLVGLPLEVSDGTYNTLFPESIDATLYSFDIGYNLETSLIQGEGYWLRFNEAGSTTISGSQINELTISLSEGWNLISGITNTFNISSIQDPDEIIIAGTVYEFSSGGYSNEEIIEPGKGYWLRANSSGSIILISE
tara:strand:- start:292 stop:1224 length:933 start_codon:yes stop_codon:yes gene_type:complete